MQCCAQAFLARSRSLLTPGAVVEHVYAFTSGQFRRSNAGEATQTTSDPPNTPSPPSSEAPSPKSEAQAPPTSAAHSITTGSDDVLLPAPPAQWHKRGAWIDPSHIEKRMFGEDSEMPDKKANKELETEVTKSVAALIKVRILRLYFDLQALSMFCQLRTCHTDSSFLPSVPTCVPCTVHPHTRPILPCQALLCR